VVEVHPQHPSVGVVHRGPALGWGAVFQDASRYQRSRAAIEGDVVSAPRAGVRTPCFPFVAAVVEPGSARRFTTNENFTVLLELVLARFVCGAPGGGLDPQPARASSTRMVFITAGPCRILRVGSQETGLAASQRARQLLPGHGGWPRGWVRFAPQPFSHPTTIDGCPAAKPPAQRVLRPIPQPPPAAGVLGEPPRPALR